MREKLQKGCFERLNLRSIGIVLNFTSVGYKGYSNIRD